MASEGHPVKSKCYPAGGSAKKIIGWVMVGVGVILILVCIPYWAYLAVLGAALIVIGLSLTRSA